MDELALEQKEEAITKEYRDFLEEVRQAFDHHCDQIKTEAAKMLENIPEEDEEARQKILNGQSVQLDKTLIELKQLLAKREAELRFQLEEITNLREQAEFSFEDELAHIEEEKKEHIA